MATIVLPVDPSRPDPSAIARAAATLRGGGLVAFPTETVYGLGANALDAGAVERIFIAKGRPAHNPVIVHVADALAARRLASDWPETADRLAKRFWPGPLTLVLPKSNEIPEIVTAGGTTVGVRVPAHPVALALLRACAAAIAAPSANRSSRISPTMGQHVLTGLDGRIDILLDAGPTSGGLESTVLDVTVLPPRVLRPGLISAAEIEAVIGRLAVAAPTSSPTPLRSPGLLVRHYAPATPLECISEGGGDYVHGLAERGIKVGWLTHERAMATDPGIKITILPDNAKGYSAELYTALHELDGAGLDRIIVTLPPRTSDWLAVHDRLQRAAAQSPPCESWPH